jgi:hypothetical protein
MAGEDEEFEALQEEEEAEETEQEEASNPQAQPQPTNDDASAISYNADYLAEKYADVINEPIKDIPPLEDAPIQEVASYDFETSDIENEANVQEWSQIFSGVVNLEANLENYSPIVAGTARAIREIPTAYYNLSPDPNFNLEEALNNADVPKEERKYYEGVVNQSAFDATAAKIDNEKLRDQIVADSGLFQKTVALAVSLFDPINIAAAASGRAVTTAVGVSRAALPNTLLNKTILGAVDGTAFAATQGAAQQLAKGEIDEERYAQEIELGALAGVACEAAGYALQSQQIKELINNSKTLVKNSWRPPKISFFKKTDSGIGVDTGISRVVRDNLMPPVYVCAANDFQTMQKLGRMSFNSQGVIGEESKQIAPSLEVRQRLADSFANKSKSDVYGAYLESGLTPEEFEQNVWLANAEWPAAKSSGKYSPEVLKACEAMQNVFKENNKTYDSNLLNGMEAIEGDFSNFLTVEEAAAGASGEDIASSILSSGRINETEQSYAGHRLWDKNKINDPNVQKRLVNLFADSDIKSQAVELVKARREGLEKAANDPKKIAFIEDSYKKAANKFALGLKDGSIRKASQARAQAQYDFILTGKIPERDRIRFKGGQTAGSPAKSRTIQIDDRIVSDYLVKDPYAIIDSSINSVMKKGLENETLIDYGYKENGWDGLFVELEDEYKGRLELATSQSDREKLLKSYNKQHENAQTYIDIMTNGGISGSTPIDQSSKEAISAMKNYAVLSKLTLTGWKSFLEDPVEIAERSGYSSLMKYYGKTFGRALTKPFYALVGKKISNNILKMEAQDLAVMGVAQEREVAKLQNKIMKLRNYTNPRNFEQTAFTKAGNRFKAGTNWLFNHNGLNSLNDFNSGFVSQALTQKISAWIKGEQTASKDVRFFESLGLTPKARTAIGAQLDKYSTYDDNILIPNLDKWDDVNAYKSFTRALKGAVDRTVIRPSVGDVLAANSPFFNKLTMFISYQSALFNNFIRPLWSSPEGRGDFFKFLGFKLCSKIVSNLCVHPWKTLGTLGIGGSGVYVLVKNPFDSDDKEDERGLLNDAVRDVFQDLGGTPGAFAGYAFDIATDSVARGREGFAYSIQRVFPPLSILGDWADLFSVAYKNATADIEKPFSERDWRKIIQCAPILSTPMIRDVIANFLAEENGGKLINPF